VLGERGGHLPKPTSLLENAANTQGNRRLCRLIDDSGPGPRHIAVASDRDRRSAFVVTHLAAGFEIGIATAWRYVQEAIALLSAAAEDLDAAMRRVRLLAYAILDGTPAPIDRVADVMTVADEGCQGARGSVRTPFKRRRFRPKLSRRQKAVNRAHAKIRARGERAIATLKTGRFWSSCAAAGAVRPRSCERSSSCITSKPTAMQDEEVSQGKS
jgi:hypothetical protein